MNFSLGFINEDAPHCHVCGLHKDTNNPKFKLAGKGALEIMLIFDKPSDMEGVTGKPFVGNQYSFVEEVLSGFGIDMREDCWKTHAINCSFSKKMTDSKLKKTCSFCGPLPTKYIKEKRPKMIICFGGEASRVLMKNRFSDTSAARWRGIPFWSSEYECWCIVTYNPSKFGDSYDTDSYKSVVKSDMVLLMDYYHKPAPKPHNPIIEKSTEYSEIISKLDEINENAKLLAVDFETTGLKPHNKGHKIATCSYTWTETGKKKDLKTFSFLCNFRDYFTKKETKEIYRRMAAIAKNKDIKKVAHHLKFEEAWTRTILKVKTKGWIWCTMYTAHILDERPKHVSLKTQAFIYFQAESYEDKLKKYLESPIPGGNSFNRVEEAPVNDLLHYNGLDTYYTFLLFFEQKKKIMETPSLYNINKLFFNGAKAFCDLEELGFGVVPGYYEKKKVEVNEQVSNLEKQILSTKEAKKFKKKMKRPFQFNNDKDIYSMIYDVLKTEVIKETAGGRASIDAEVLMGLAKSGNEWSKLFLSHTKLCTARDTFIDGMLKEVNEKSTLHTFYHLSTTRTGRSSATMPNMTNQPKRDKIVKELVRSGIVSSIPNGIICEADYGSLEVRIAGCYTKDPVLLKYINDTSTDMHRDTAIDLFLLDKNTNKKEISEIRFYAKNGYVFANFYGASPKSCARSLWKVVPDLKLPDGTPLGQHLDERGLGHYADFEQHIIKYSTAFWKKFKVFKKWQEETIAFYQKNGFIENKFGFRRRGFLGRNEIINTNIQGSAFQCLLWSLIEVSKEMKKRKLISRNVGQIHDSLITFIHPDELDEVTHIIKYVMEDKLRETFPWVITPMDAEFEITEPGGNWNTLKDYVVTLPRNFRRF